MVTLKPFQTVRIGDDIVIGAMVDPLGNNSVRVFIEAPLEVPILRADAVKREAQT